MLERPQYGSLARAVVPVRRRRGLPDPSTSEVDIAVEALRHCPGQGRCRPCRDYPAVKAGLNQFGDARNVSRNRRAA